MFRSDWTGGGEEGEAWREVEGESARPGQAGQQQNIHPSYLL